MTRTFYSKIDLWLIVILLLGISPAWLPLIWDFDWVLLIIDVLLIGLLAYLFRNTKYVVDGDKLIVRVGFLSLGTCDIHQVLSISKTHTLLSAPALSLDRLKVNLRGGDILVVSPKHRKEFLDALLVVNPKIVVDIS